MLGKNLRSLWIETSPDKAIARARRFVEKGRHDAAIASLKEVIEAVGEEADIRFELAQIQLACGQGKEAADGLKGFLKIHPEEHRRVHEIVDWARVQHIDVGPIQEILAEHHVARRELAPALEALERVDKKDLQSLLDSKAAHLARFLEKTPAAVPKSALPLLYLTALIHEALHEDPKALEVYRRIAAAHPGEAAALEGRLKGIRARNYRSAPIRSLLAEIYLGAKSADRAMEEYVQIVEADPRSAPQAAAALEKMAAESPDPIPALWALARVRRKEGKVEDLLRAAGRLIAAGGNLDDLRALLEGVAAEGSQDPRVQLMIGEASLGSGKPSRAVTAFASVTAHPSPEIRTRALEGLERILAAHPEDARALQGLADATLKDGKLDRCVGLLERLVAADPAAAPAAASRLQTLLLSRPGHPGAEALLEKIASGSGDARLNAAFLRRRLRARPEEAEGARQTLQGLLAQDTADAEIRIAASEACAACGRMEEAWELLKPLIDATMGPDPSLLHLMVMIGGNSRASCHDVSEHFRTMAPALASAPEGLFALGEMAAKAGEMQAALEAFRGAASFSAAAAADVIAAVRDLGGGLAGEAAVALAEALLDAGDVAGAASVVRSASTLPPSSARILGKFEEALRAHPEDADLRVALAAALAAGGRASRGRELVEDGIRRAGEAASPVLHLAAGDAWLREGNLTEAVRAYSRAMARDKSLAAEAARRLERVLETDVGHAMAHLTLGRARLLDGRPREGVNSILTAWSIQPSLGGAILKDLAYAARAFPLEPQVDLARSQILLGQGEVESASDAIGSALMTSPAIADEALVRLHAILRSHPSCARAHLHVARAWLDKGRCAEASAAFAAAVEHDPNLAEPAAAGLAELRLSFPDSPEPNMTQGKIHEQAGNLVGAVEAYAAAAARGTLAEEAAAALRRLAGREGSHQAAALTALGRAARALGRFAEAAEALEKAALAAPERMAEVRQGIDEMAALQPDIAEVLRARARIALAGLDAATAVEEADRLLEAAPGLWSDVNEIARAAAEGGADSGRCAWLRARALTAGGELDEASRLLETWHSRCEGDLRARMYLLRARVERRRGDVAASRRWTREAEAHAADRGAFLAALHAETVESARQAARKDATTSDLWRALKACLDLGDADAAERIAGRLGLARGAGQVPDAAAVEAAARIAFLRGRHDEAARLLEPAAPSTFKAHVLARAGRPVEAAACLAEAGLPSEELSAAFAPVLRRAASAEILREPPCLEAETRITFSTSVKGEAS